MKTKLLVLLAVLAAFVLCFGIDSYAVKGTAVSTPEELMNMEPNGDYYLAGDILLYDVKWKPIKNFSGTFDGNGYEVVGLRSETYGLFASLSTGAEVRNVILRDAYITSKYKTVGGIAAIIESGADVEIDNCCVSGVVSSCRTKYKQSSKGSTAGAIVGKNNSSSAVISCCYSSAVVTSEQNVGGIVGINRGTVKDCGFEGQTENSYNIDQLAVSEGEGKDDVYSYLYCSGGIAGINYGEISNCFSSCTRLESGIYYGGIVGALQKGGKISCCVNSSNVLYGDYFGGLIAGYAPYQSEISGCYTKAPEEDTVQNDVGKGKKDTVTYGFTEEEYGDISDFKGLDSGWIIWDGVPKLKNLQKYFIMPPLYEIKGGRLFEIQYNEYP